MVMANVDTMLLHCVCLRNKTLAFLLLPAKTTTVLFLVEFS